MVRISVSHKGLIYMRWRRSISELQVDSALQIAHQMFDCCPMLHPRIVVKSAQDRDSVCNIGTSFCCKVEQSTHCRDIGDVLHCYNFNRALWRHGSCETKSRSHWSQHRLA